MLKVASRFGAHSLNGFLSKEGGMLGLNRFKEPCAGMPIILWEKSRK